MEKYSVCYIGNMYQIAEDIIFHDKLNLELIFTEKGKVSDELLTLSFIHNIKLIEINEPSEIVKYVKKIDFAVMCSYGRKIPTKLLSSLKIYNIHYGMLPDYKGRHPSFYAFLNNEKFLGISLHEVDENIDTGRLISIYKIENRLKTSEREVFQLQTEYARKILDDLLCFLENPKYISFEGGGNYYSPVSKKLTMVDIEVDSVLNILNKVKAQARYGGPEIIFGNTRYIVKYSTLTKDDYMSYKKITSNIYFDRDKFYILKEDVILKLTCEKIV
ncbi:formyltransferase family protein [Francisella salimarina]|uniref:formyltransferase family protein n=1 Tax=Francisella salimarina TaxID=2599927 RepID=UPI003751E788